jgi:hypothetical protein
MSSGAGETLNALDGANVAIVREKVKDVVPTTSDDVATSRLRYFDGFAWRTGH